jgi:hypothetical protein
LIISNKKILNGYQSGLEAYWNQSIEQAKAKGRGRQSTPKWQNATVLAKEATAAARLGRIQWEENNVEESKKSAEMALEYISKRYVMCCFVSYGFGELPINSFKVSRKPQGSE